MLISEQLILVVEHYLFVTFLPIQKFKHSISTINYYISLQN